MPAGVLEVTIVEGRNLKDKDMVGHNDAYIELYLDKKYKQRTTTVKDTNNPVWNQSFRFNVDKHDDTITFKVFDEDIVGKDDIGKCKVKLKHVFDDGKFNEWVKLPAMLGLSSNGELRVVMSFKVRRLRFSRFIIGFCFFLVFLAVVTNGNRRYELIPFFYFFYFHSTSTVIPFE